MQMSLEELLETRMKAQWPYRVDIHRRKADKEMREWCEQNCREDFDILLIGNYSHIARFKSNRDMILFTLTWS